MPKSPETPDPSLQEVLEQRLLSGGADDLSGGKPITYRDEPIEVREHDLVLGIQNILVRRPEQPAWINNSPFAVEVNADSLVSEVTEMRSRGRFRGHREPRMVDISLGNSLLPHIDNGESEPDPVGFDVKTGTLHAVIPQEVAKADVEAKELAAKVEDAANRDLAVAMTQAMKFRNWWSTQRFINGGILAATGVATEAAVLLADHEHAATKLLDAGLLSVLGVSAAAIGLFGVGMVREDPDTRGSRKAYDQAKQVAPEFDEPIIKLVPIEEPQAA